MGSKMWHKGGVSFGANTFITFGKIYAVIGNPGWQVLYHNNSFYESYLTLLGIRFLFLLSGV